MTIPQRSGRPVVLLAAHGERGGAGDDARLARLTAEVAGRLPDADVTTVLVSSEDAVDAALAACGGRPVACLPLLFSDGFFFTQRLTPYFGKAGRRLAQPLALWPGFVALLGDELARRLGGVAVDRVILVAHGSKRSGPSAEVARRLAGELASIAGPVEAAFLEEAPFAADVVPGAGGAVALVGLFLGDGLHGGEDLGRLARGSSPVAAFTAGQLETLAGFVAERAAVELAALRRS